MKVKYAERGTFDAQKAAKGLVELTIKIKQCENDNEKRTDIIK
jgi:hypothetical protein